MSQASDYPVTFPYGATDGVYYYTPTPQHPKTAKWIRESHIGDDHAMPNPTAVLVNGCLIGYSGTRYGGDHLHIGRFVNGLPTNPNGGGFSFKVAVVSQVGSDDINGNFVRLAADGASWVYLHLSKISCRVGQMLIVPAPAKKGEDMNATKEQLIVLYAMAFPNEALNNDWVAANTGRDMSVVLTSLKDDPSRQAFVTQLVMGKNSAQQLANMQANLDTLHAQVDELSAENAKLKDPINNTQMMPPITIPAPTQKASGEPNALVRLLAKLFS